MSQAEMDKALRQAGKACREIADYFGLEKCQVKSRVNRYIPFCNYERIQTKTGVTPLTLRHSV